MPYAQLLPSLLLFSAFYITGLIAYGTLSVLGWLQPAVWGGSLIILIAAVLMHIAAFFRNARLPDRQECRRLAGGALMVDLMVQYSLWQIGSASAMSTAQLLGWYLLGNVLPMAIGMLYLGPYLAAKVARRRSVSRR